MQTIEKRIALTDQIGKNVLSAVSSEEEALEVGVEMLVALTNIGSDLPDLIKEMSPKRIGFDMINGIGPDLRDISKDNWI